RSVPRLRSRLPNPLLKKHRLKKPLLKKQRMRLRAPSLVVSGTCLV
ncbi:uncharacterized protein METZ01_LOCUS339383, partial [marine metagenome]